MRVVFFSSDQVQIEPANSLVGHRKRKIGEGRPNYRGIQDPQNVDRAVGLLKSAFNSTSMYGMYRMHRSKELQGQARQARQDKPGLDSLWKAEN